ncbi:CinA family nicotinamide mononucleotide deamidase-related protein [Chromatocurvus halotolerans]|uniref:CinA-like protein n=1 Tax=Chromatocurvus halotolerans TaxID=1132028 RepID=A0A4R2KKX5_9GAMM|nr:CinA family nicotinamide mononucleotide deamidase-related protein [Chromatocurvus halotolerans]TCO74671.1 nicotinamide-nucleotide amidase [Chromatocurvus halotolerans]
MSTRTPRIQMLLTGSELMSGDTVDSNSAMVGQRLGELGITLERKITLDDDLDALTAAIREISTYADILIVNGGLGPTVDDLTAAALAAAAGVALGENPRALAHIESWCEQRQIPMDAANRKQAQLPAGSDILPNITGSAVGIAMTLGDCRVLCTPGVPGELRNMLDSIIDDIRHRHPDLQPRHILRLQTFGLGESAAQQCVADALPDWPQQVSLGFRAGAPQMEIKLTAASDADPGLQAGCREQLESLFGDHIIGEGNATLAARVLQLLSDRGRQITTAESCTGGLIASMLTRVPGSSAAFEAGFVTYSNRMKRDLLAVPEALLEAHGAVSEPVVRAMAEGALARSGADMAIAVSGIAGPDGGSAEKPVGTVWIAWGSAADLHSCGLCWPVERSLFQTMVAAAGLDLIRRQLLALPPLSWQAERRRIDATR